MTFILDRVFGEYKKEVYHPYKNVTKNVVFLHFLYLCSIRNEILNLFFAYEFEQLFYKG